MCATGIQVAEGCGGADVGFACFYSVELSKYVLWEHGDNYPYDCAISVDGDTLYGLGVPVGNSPAWVGSTYCIYRSGVYWLLRAKDEMGYSKPSDTSGTAEFWSYDGPNPYSATFVKKGTAALDKTADIDSWARWEKSTFGGFYGVYTAAGGAAGTKVIGVPQYIDENDNVFVRSVQKKIYSLTRRAYVYSGAEVTIESIGGSELWVMGSYLSDGGWHQSSTEPNVSSPVTFEFTTRPGQENPPSGEDIVLSFDKYVVGLGVGSNNYIGEASIWRT